MAVRQAGYHIRVETVWNGRTYRATGRLLIRCELCDAEFHGPRRKSLQWTIDHALECPQQPLFPTDRCLAA